MLVSWSYEIPCRCYGSTIFTSPIHLLFHRYPMQYVWLCFNWCLPSLPTYSSFVLHSLSEIWRGPRRTIHLWSTQSLYPTCWLWYVNKFLYYLVKKPCYFFLFSEDTLHGLYSHVHQSDYLNILLESDASINAHMLYLTSLPASTLLSRNINMMILGNVWSTT